MTLPSRNDYLQSIETDGAILGAVSPDNLTLTLPHIEGWTVHDVIAHMGWVFRWVTLNVQRDEDDPPQRGDVPEPPAGPAVLDWYQNAFEGIKSEFSVASPDKIVNTFTGPQPVSWWIRRLAHETAMHRWDAESAIGTPTPFDVDLSRDGIDEVLEIFVPSRMQFDVLGGNGETIHLHATDAPDGEWVLTLQENSVEWEHAHQKSDVAARGPMSDLLLLLWGRLPPSRLELFGDASLLDRWQKAAHF